LIAYRLTRSKFADDLAGTGGLYSANRCNRKGTAVIYASQHRSLALVEVLAHVSFDNLPLDYEFITIEIPETVPVRQAAADEVLAVSAGPPVPVFFVPSVIVPQESNVVMFPQTAGFNAKVIKKEPFHIDERLLGKR
jgi:RES domain-containing protein